MILIASTYHRCSKSKNWCNVCDSFVTAMKTLKLLRNPIAVTNSADKEQISLSARAIEVLEQLGTGLSYTAIADNLILSPSTVRKHIENIYKKLQVHSKIEAVQKARNHNLI